MVPVLSEPLLYLQLLLRVSAEGEGVTGAAFSVDEGIIIVIIIIALEI
jgi:hypothetical protein